MSDRATPGLEPQRAGRRPTWLWWPITFALAVGGALGFHNDAVEAKLEWLYWAAVWVVAAFYAVVALVYLVIFARRLWRRWTEVVEKARLHDEVAAELISWKTAAGEATARALDAEARVATWHLDGLKEGRRRLLGELRASAVRTAFRDVEVAIVGEVLVIGARWSGQLPEVDARYVMRSTTLKEHKAVLECLETRTNRTAVFRVSSVVSESYRSQLFARASAVGSVLTDVEIGPRVDDLKEEPIWPEN